MATTKRKRQAPADDASPESQITTIAMPPELHRELRLLAVERRTTLRALVLEACRAHLTAARKKGER